MDRTTCENNSLQSCASSTTQTECTSHLPYDAVIFDFDGTLADTREKIIEVAKQVLPSFGLTPDRFKDIPQLIGPAFPQAFTIVFGYSPEEAEKITSAYRAIYTQIGSDAWPLFDGMHELLSALHEKGIVVSAASSKRDDLLRRALKDNDVYQYFTYPEGKLDDSDAPKAKTLAHVLERIGVSPVRAVMVGDRNYDIEAAKACGIDSIGVYYGNTAPQGELEEAGATKIVYSVVELAHALGVSL